MSSIEILEERISSLVKQHDTEMKAMADVNKETRTRLKELESRERNYLFKGLMALGIMVLGSSAIGYGVSRL